MKHLKAHIKASCSNCYYAQQLFQHEFYCYGQKGMPRVSAHSCCESYRSKSKSNADKIREMSDEDLAEYLARVRVFDNYAADAKDIEICRRKFLAWLKLCEWEGGYSR